VSIIEEVSSGSLAPLVVPVETMHARIVLAKWPARRGQGSTQSQDATEVPKLRLVESRPFRSGIVLLRYRTA
jgi:hypothetical protein